MAFYLADIKNHLKKPHNQKLIKRLNLLSTQKIKKDYNALIRILSDETQQLRVDITGYNIASQENQERMLAQLTTLTTLYNYLNRMRIDKAHVQNILNDSERRLTEIRERI